MEKYTYKDFALNKSFDLGAVTLTEQEIMDYARLNDPLEIHTNKEVAAKSIFKGLVSSGSQILNTFHVRTWIKMFGDSIICGLEINNWKLLKPIYANQTIKGKVTIAFFKPNPEKRHCIVTWHYEFADEKCGELVQVLDITVMHKME